MLYVLALTILLSVSVASAQSSRNSGIQNFTVIDPMTGRVETGTVTQTPGGGQSYNWVNPYTGETTTGTVSPPIGGTSNFSTFNSTTGQVGVGSIHTAPPNNAPVFMPQPPQGGTMAPGAGQSER